MDEREKYEKMWTMPQYRAWSPAASTLDQAIEALSLTKPTEIIDLGTGTGRAAARLRGMGHRVLGFDIAHNCLDEPTEDFMVGCLWDMPRELEFPYGICIDVMEHIPTQHVSEVFVNMRRVAKCVYFDISLNHDSCGRLIGETLHMTVKPARWWLEQLRAVWDEVTVLDTSRSVRAVVR